MNNEDNKALDDYLTNDWREEIKMKEPCRYCHKEFSVKHGYAYLNNHEVVCLERRSKSVLKGVKKE